MIVSLLPEPALLIKTSMPLNVFLTSLIKFKI